MKLPEISVDYLGTIVIDPYEHVTVELPDGREVVVYSDKIYLRTIDDQVKRKSGFRLWWARPGPRESKRYPYGQAYLTDMGE